MSTAIVSPRPVPHVPALIAGAGERAAWRFLEFFTVNIRNPNTRAAYAHAAGDFLRWCEKHGRGLSPDIRTLLIPIAKSYWFDPESEAKLMLHPPLEECWNIA